MDVGIYNKKTDSKFLDHHYFKPLVYSPVGEKMELFQANTTKSFLIKHKNLISFVLNILIIILIIYLIMLLTGSAKKCLKRIKK